MTERAKLLYDTVISSDNEDIVTDAKSKINEFINAFTDLGNSATDYNLVYDTYQFLTLKDATILKEKMKDIVSITFEHDI